MRSLSAKRRERKSPTSSTVWGPPMFSITIAVPLFAVDGREGSDDAVARKRLERYGVLRDLRAVNRELDLARVFLLAGSSCEAIRGATEAIWDCVTIMMRVCRGVG